LHGYFPADVINDLKEAILLNPLRVAPIAPEEAFVENRSFVLMSKQFDRF
jgi:hypothetical protein